MDKGNRIVFLTLGTLGNILSRRQIDFFIYRRLTLSMLGKILAAEVLIYFFFAEIRLGLFMQNCMKCQTCFLQT